MLTVEVATDGFAGCLSVRGSGHGTARLVGCSEWGD